MADINFLKVFFIILSLFNFCNISLQMNTINNANITDAQIIAFMETIATYTPSDIFNIEEAEISLECTKAMEAYKNGFTKNFKEWALSMFDASSKLQSGIMAGNYYNLGSYEECQAIQNIQIQETESTYFINGKYCLGEAISPLFRWAICVPDLCNANELNSIMKSNSLPFTFNEIKCHSSTQDPAIDGGDIAVIACFGIIGLLMIISSIYDSVLRHFEMKAPHPILLAFSVITNGEKLLSTKKSADQIECMSGIRFISMMWVVLGHYFSTVAIQPITDVNKLLGIYGDIWTMTIRGAPLAVDSFFLMSGIVTVYVYLKASKNKKFFNVPLYYLHRYLRLTPALAAVIVVHLTILKHLGSGPYWFKVDLFEVNFCREYWWSALLYIQNFVNVSTICIGQSWYLSCDTQLFLISPIFLIPLNKWPKATLTMALIAALASTFAGFGIAWENKLFDSNSILLEMAHPTGGTDYMDKYYTQTYARAAPYFIGMIIGYVIYQVKIKQRKFHINAIINLLLWAYTISVMAVCVFYDTAMIPEYHQFNMSAYIAFVRPAWSIGLSWIIFACLTGYGGPVNTFLSATIFQILGRFTYSMYLTHMTIMLVIGLSSKQPMAFSTWRVLFDYWSMLCLVFAVGVLWALTFESPVLIMEKCIFGGIGSNAGKRGKLQKNETKQNEMVIAVENSLNECDNHNEINHEFEQNEIEISDNNKL